MANTPVWYPQQLNVGVPVDMGAGFYSLQRQLPSSSLMAAVVACGIIKSVSVWQALICFGNIFIYRSHSVL
jgi:hypothetical protein